MRARTGLWEPRVGNDPGPPGPTRLDYGFSKLAKLAGAFLSRNASNAMATKPRSASFCLLFHTRTLVPTTTTYNDGRNIAGCAATDSV